MDLPASIRPEYQKVVETSSTAIKLTNLLFRQNLKVLDPKAPEVDLSNANQILNDRSAAVHVFTPALDRDELVGRRLQAVAEKLCGGLMGPLLTHLVKAETLTPKERQELRQLMDELESKNRRKDRRE